MFHPCLYLCWKIRLYLYIHQSRSFTVSGFLYRSFVYSCSFTNSFLLKVIWGQVKLAAWGITRFSWYFGWSLHPLPGIPRYTSWYTLVYQTKKTWYLVQKAVYFLVQNQVFIYPSNTNKYQQIPANTRLWTLLARKQNMGILSKKCKENKAKKLIFLRGNLVFWLF